jgi:transcriptional regulator with XRE-family HTH domain
MASFGENLMILRKRKGLKQAEVAEMLGITGAAWSEYERNRSEPSIKDLLKISKILDCDVVALLSGLPTVNETPSSYETSRDQVDKHMQELLAAKDEIIALLKKRIEELEGM